MQVHYEIEDFQGNRPVVTVGIFDGVHLGHRYILDQLIQRAEKLSGDSLVLTLWPHPRTVLDPANDNFSLLNTLEEKIDILDRSGVDHLVILPFTRAFSRKASCEFIEEFLVEKLRIAHLLVGYNHRFGRDREGNFNKLSACAARFGFGIEKLDARRIDGKQVSSSVIRRALNDGRVEEASELLGRPYVFSGTVVGGSRLGSSIGFPTANITPESETKLMPPNGVYAVRVRLRERSHIGMMNIGTRPTVNDDTSKRTFEVHLIDFDENIYAEPIQIEFIAFLRQEHKFQGIEELRQQLLKDRDETLRVFEERT